MFATRTCNLKGYVGKPFSRTFKLTSNGVAYDLTGKTVEVQIADSTAQGSVVVNVVAHEGEIEITTESLEASVSSCKWSLTIGKEGVLLAGTFEFNTL